MLCLALDTTTAGGSCAVTRDGVIICERRGHPDRAHETRLPRDLMMVLEEGRLTLRDIDLYAVATGPGSFTGLRIGIATMQGLAFAAGKPLLGVSGFDALARSVHGAPAVATWVDAWRGDVFAARYERDIEVEPPTVEKPQAILARMTAPTLFIGDAVPLYADLITRTCGDRALCAEPAAPPLAAIIAAIATESARLGQRPAPDEIRPLYVRRPDAELARDARLVR